MIKDDNKRVSITIKAYRERIRKLRKGRIDEVIDEMMFFAWDGDEFSGESKLYENKANLSKEQAIKEQHDFTRSKFDSDMPKSVGDMKRWIKWHDEAMAKIELEYQ